MIYGYYIGYLDTVMIVNYRYNIESTLLFKCFG